MKEFIIIGGDLGKNYFQVHALESEDGGATTRKLSCQAMHKLFAETRPCLAGQAFRYGSLWFGSLLGARTTSGDGPRGALDSADRRQARCQARQERRRRRGRDRHP